jgi:hypothetical protein
MRKGCGCNVFKMAIQYHGDCKKKITATFLVYHL